LVHFLDEWAHVDPWLFLDWLAFPILEVSLLQVELFNDVEHIEEQFWGGLLVFCKGGSFLTIRALFEQDLRGFLQIVWQKGTIGCSVVW
jgi:hypothetical protein